MEDTTSMDDLISRPAAARLLGVQEGQLRRWERNGRLQVAYRIPSGRSSRILYFLGDIKRIAEERAVLTRAS